jgi:hypothetical protein
LGIFWYQIDRIENEIRKAKDEISAYEKVGIPEEEIWEYRITPFYTLKQVKL